MVVCLDEILDRFDIFRTPAFLTFQSKWFISSFWSKMLSLVFLSYAFYNTVFVMKEQF